MTDLVKQLAPQIIEAINQSERILLHCHPSPDPDSYGSTLAMRQALLNMNKQVTVIAGDSAKPQAFSFLPGFDQVEPKTWFDVDLNQFDLFISQDSGGLNQISKKGEIIFPESLNVVVIDHHASNHGYGKINLVDPSYIAVCQLLADLFELWQINVTPNIARCLLVGIYTDSGGLKYSLVTPDTLRTFTKLAEIYPDFTNDIFLLENSQTPGRVIIIGLALSNISLHLNGNLAISAVSFDQLQQHQITKSDTEKSGIANHLISVVGWNVGVSLIECEPGIVSVGFRTRDADKYDVSLLASNLGGGGHKAASGAQVNGTIEEAINKVAAAAEQLWNL